MEFLYMLGGAALVFGLCWVWVGGYVADFIIWIISKFVPSHANEQNIAMFIGVLATIIGLVVGIAAIAAGGDNSWAAGALIIGVGFYVAVRIPGKIRAKRIKQAEKAAQSSPTPASSTPGVALNPQVPAISTAPAISAVSSMSTMPPAPTALAPVALAVCPKCGFDINPGKKFCRNCGTVLNVAPQQLPASPTTAACPKCGAAINPQAKFCRNCGTMLSGTARQHQRTRARQ